MVEQALTSFLKTCKERVDQELASCLQPNTPSADTQRGHTRLGDAMSYSLLNGGKRIRPSLVYAAALTMGEITADTDRVASAVELIHAYSLIHDDLPAMDNDELRRGKPTCHIAYDEATAILAGDGLQALAFHQLTCLQQATPETALKLIRLLADAAGPRGMVAGQAIDLSLVNQKTELPVLENMHRCKTGALIAASVMMGASLSGAAGETQLVNLCQYGDAIGLAFQVKDDILDEEAETATLGKRNGADKALNKPTYTSLLGLDGARQKLAELHREAINALRDFGGNAQYLRAIADYIVEREY